MNYVWAGAGFIFFALGVVGVALPLLPTTPFLILASFCFAKSSDRFNDWFKSTSLYQNHLEDFEKSRSMKLSTKLAILIPVNALLLTAILMMANPFGQATVAIVMIVKNWYIVFRVKTLPTPT